MRRWARSWSVYGTCSARSRSRSTSLARSAPSTPGEEREPFRQEARRARGLGAEGRVRVTGRQTCSTNAPVAHFVTVAARTSHAAGLGSIALVLVDGATGGLQVGGPIEKLGTRSAPTRDVHLAR